ncbi:MAG TPA: hypothetical protein PKL23_06610 [Candidatus Egerieousia sp.]|nr:hypothetical protein [Candidatus Egerieousia sp.]
MENKDLEKENFEGTESTELSLKDMVRIAKEWWKYLLARWVLIVIFGLVGAAIGLTVSLTSKPKYTAHLSFALMEKGTGASGLASLASSFGYDIGGGSANAFSGDNLLEIIKSQRAVEQALLTPVNYYGRRENLIEAYISVTKMRKGWERSKKKEIRELSYPIGQQARSLSRVQDSVMNVIYNTMSKSGSLSVAKINKTSGIVNVDFTSGDELFAKLFVENLMDQTYRFYRETKTAQSRANIAMMQHTADSVKRLYDAALYKGAAVSQVNMNMAMQYVAVPKIKQQTDAQLYGTVYAEVLKNLETLKLDMARETPLVQIIDTPQLPLEKQKIGKIKGTVTGGLVGGVLIILYLLGARYVKKEMRDDEDALDQN